jgi:hypothetical protein
LRDKDHFKDPGVQGRIILKWAFEKWDGGHGLDQRGSKQGQVTSSCECGNDSSDYIKCGEFLEKLRTC